MAIQLHEHLGSSPKSIFSSIESEIPGHFGPVWRAKRLEDAARDVISSALELRTHDGKELDIMKTPFPAAAGLALIEAAAARKMAQHKKGTSDPAHRVFIHRDERIGRGLLSLSGEQPRDLEHRTDESAAYNFIAGLIKASRSARRL